jgi:3-phenylpropionate/trans-cinnamate dioxygenase ferredoxin component
VATFYDAAPTDWVGPGETGTVSVDGFPIALANVDGVFYAFQNMCPHQATSLGGRPLESSAEITCPQHGSRYDVRTGACLKPATDGFSAGLRTFEVEVVDSVVRVRL